MRVGEELIHFLDRCCKKWASVPRLLSGIVAHFTAWSNDLWVREQRKFESVYLVIFCYSATRYSFVRPFNNFEHNIHSFIRAGSQTTKHFLSISFHRLGSLCILSVTARSCDPMAGNFLFTLSQLPLHCNFAIIINRISFSRLYAVSESFYFQPKVW